MNIYKNGYLYHFLFGVIAAMAFYKFGFYWSWIATIAIATGKEIYDKVGKKGTVEIEDFLVTLAGGVIGLFIECLTDMIVQWLN